VSGGEEASRDEADGIVHGLCMVLIHAGLDLFADDTDVPPEGEFLAHRIVRDPDGHLGAETDRVADVRVPGIRPLIGRIRNAALREVKSCLRIVLDRIQRLLAIYGILSGCQVCGDQQEAALADTRFNGECQRATGEPIVDDANDLFPRVVVNFRSTDPDRKEKLATWDDVYKIKSRVEGEFKELAAKLAEDAGALHDTSFLAKLRDSGRAKARAQRLTPFNYWRARVYAAVRCMNPRSREALRKATALTPQEAHEMDTLFF
jgi:hypothetical protein